MKKKPILKSLLFAIALLFSIVFQSFHGYEHLEKQISEKVCYHKHLNKAELTHQHKVFEHCLVCSIAFSSYVFPHHFSTKLYFVSPEIPYFSIENETIFSFSGSLYSHRGPPFFV